MALSLVGRLLEQVEPDRDQPWSEFLKKRIDPDWRPGEFQFDRMLFAPDPASGNNTMSVCRREGCTTKLQAAQVCPTCRSEYRRSGTSLTVREWVQDAPPRVEPNPRMLSCEVPNCERTFERRGLCVNHALHFGKWLRVSPGGTVHEWILAESPEPKAPLPKCQLGCRKDAYSRDLCHPHHKAYRSWVRLRYPVGERDVDVATWLEHDYEPPLSESESYAEGIVTAFGLLPEPLRWELLYAVQQQDMAGRLLNPIFLRGVYAAHRRSGTSTFVGMDALGFEDAPRTKRGICRQWQRHIDDAYRNWTGVDDRDPKIIYMRDLVLSRNSKTPGPDAKIDLRPISQTWIIDGIKAWIEATPRNYDTVSWTASVWVLAAEVLAARGTPIDALGVQDMDAIVNAIRERWASNHAQKRAIRPIALLLAFVRTHDEFDDTWGRIPARFTINPARHRPRAETGTMSGEDEPYRFVPQPVIEHLMNNLHLMVRTSQHGTGPNAYATAEARAMLYLHERCGRRTSETVRLRDDCVSYDNEGAPYLGWVRGKPPYTPGKRLPIHQETHDVIRQWQDIKREHGIESQWLFPNRKTNSNVDKPWKPEYLRQRLKHLIRAVQESAPMDGPVEGAEGNLILVDLESIDAYSFRHAFAQRYADATDGEGRSTTPPDVLQDLMGHANFNTTMVYYNVSTNRRKQAVEAVPARRLNLLGEVVPVDRERDPFTKVAVSAGHCSEPQNVAQHGHGCMVDHACESCPFFLVDPLERETMDAKRHALRVRLERARAVGAQQHLLDHYAARIADCTTLIDGIDAYIAALPEVERAAVLTALHSMSETRRLATLPRLIDLRSMLGGEARS